MTPTDWQTGRVQVYTGDGKGKTTAALGLALRAAGAGLKVFIAQFMKGMHYSELDALKRLDDCIEIGQFGSGSFISGEPTPEDVARARAGLAAVREVFAAGRHRLVILDEANIATYFGLFAVDDLLDLIDAKPANVELVITGRRADPRVLDRADLVTEVRAVKHYYERGVEARRGIES
jgi:cob(I)alamin adenosyltransferase